MQLSRRRVVAFIALVAILVAGAPARAEGIHVVVLEGTPYERGVTHGETLKSEIEHLVQDWKADLRHTYGTDPDALVELFLAETNFVPAIERWTPGLLDELRGIAAGSGIDFDTILAYNLPDELWANGPEIVRNRCTSIGVDAQGDAPAYVAQNLDIPGWYHHHPTVLHVKHADSDLESFVVSVPGLVGANGVNNRSVGVCVNTILQLKPSRTGLPVAFVVRGILAQESHAQALEFVRTIEHASGQNYIVGGPETAPGFECSQRVVTRFVPFEGAQWTYHTNHPLANENHRASYARRLTESGPYACPRFATLQELLKAGTQVDRETIEKTLSTRNAGIPINNSSTYVCTIMVLAEEPELHVSAGRPDEVPFEVLRF